MENITEHVADLIKEARKVKSLSQKDLAEKIGIDATTLNRFENGKQNLTIQTLQRISDALGCKLLIDLK